MMGSSNFSDKDEKKHDHGVAVTTQEVDTGAELLTGAPIAVDEAEARRIRHFLSP